MTFLNRPCLIDKKGEKFMFYYYYYTKYMLLLLFESNLKSPFV